MVKGQCKITGYEKKQKVVPRNLNLEDCNPEEMKGNCPPPNNDHSVPVAVNQIQHASKRLEQRLNQLAERLQPVLVSTALDQGSGEKLLYENTCELADTLFVHGRCLDSLTGLVDDLLARLEL